MNVNELFRPLLLSTILVWLCSLYKSSLKWPSVCLVELILSSPAIF